MTNKVILWDFDGTLGFRKDGMWGASMIEALLEYDPQTTLTAPSFRSFLISGFPWHNPETTHTHITTSEEWWEPILNKFVQGYSNYGIDYATALKLAQTAKQKFIHIERWTLFEDTMETLELLREYGWKHVIVSNHIPELIDIVKELGLGDQVDFLVNSAIVGYEKPNPKIYEHALELTSRPTDVWMVGDNVEADYFGAEAIGIKSILVHNMDSRATRNCKELREVVKIIEG
jgi:putative hydrolase of the HAD superfamily